MHKKIHLININTIIINNIQTEIFQAMEPIAMLTEKLALLYTDESTKETFLFFCFFLFFLLKRCNQ